MTQLLAGFNGTIKKAQNKVLAEKIKYASLGQRKAAQTFITAHFDDIGVKSTVDLRAEAQAEWA